MSRSKICRAIADCSATQCSVLPAAVLRRLSVLRGTSTIMAENEQKNVSAMMIDVASEAINWLLLPKIGNGSMLETYSYQMIYSSAHVEVGHVRVTC